MVGLVVSLPFSYNYEAMHTHQPLLFDQLIMYWYGIPDSEGFNLATCIWQSRRHAIAANSRPNHVIAARLAAASFETYTFERHVIRKVKGETGIAVERYTGGDVGW